MPNSTEIIKNETAIPGLLEFTIAVMKDDRGYFQEKFQKAKLVAVGLPESFNPVQQNISFNFKEGTIRGLHAEPWNKFVSVIRGKVFAAFVDLRKGETFGNAVSLIIDENKAVYVPNGVANSYQTLVSDVYYSYLVDDHWSSDKSKEYQSLNVADESLGIKWPIEKSKWIISQKDKNNPMLGDIR